MSLSRLHSVRYVPGDEDLQPETPNTLSIGDIRSSSFDADGSSIASESGTLAGQVEQPFRRSAACECRGTGEDAAGGSSRACEAAEAAFERSDLHASASMTNTLMRSISSITCG